MLFSGHTGIFLPAEVSQFLVSDLSTAAVHPNIKIMALNLNDEEVGSLV